MLGRPLWWSSSVVNCFRKKLHHRSLLSIFWGIAKTWQNFEPYLTSVNYTSANTTDYQIKITYLRPWITWEYWLSWRIAVSSSVCTFLKTRMRASIFARSCPSISRNSSSDKPDKFTEGPNKACGIGTPT